jgi:hypothetical protein
MVVDGPLLFRGVNLNHQLGQMASTGVQAIRLEFNWSHAQPYASWKDVPLAYRGYFSGPETAVPTDFLATDRIVGLAARHHLAVLPVVIDAPSWDAYRTGNHLEPLHDAPYATYVKELVERYGSRGTFWAAHRSIPREPVTSWQIWNEPNLPYFWDNPDWAPSYVKLLKAARHVVKQADPKARVVLASLTGDSWRGLALIYHVHGARSLFDVVGENTYAPSAGQVVTLLLHVRRTMDRNGDRNKPLIDTEIGWPSALGKSGLTLGVATTRRGQAQKLSRLLPLLAANRKALDLQSFFYYTWMSTDQVGSLSPFAFAGLYRYELANHQIYAKPAATVFKQAVLRMEGRG